MNDINKKWENSEDQFKNKSSWADSFLGRVKTDEYDNYYENLQTKISYKILRHKKFYSMTKQLYNLYYNFTGPFHILPNFLILGPGACGTTSMVELYLRTNKHILPSDTNEIFYFNNNFYKSLNWYKVFFPNKFQKICRAFFGKKTLTCEATGNYIFYPHTAKRIKKILPDAKFIVMMRNPIDRTFSHYRRQVFNKRQELSFEDAIELELKTFEKEYENFEKDETLMDVIAPTTSYLARSRYVEGINRWLQYFPKNQFLFINSNEYFKNSIPVYNKILEFLDLESHYPVVKGKRGIVPPKLMENIKLKDDTRKFLQNYFKPWNEKLFKVIGEEYDWN